MAGGRTLLPIVICMSTNVKVMAMAGKRWPKNLIRWPLPCESLHGMTNRICSASELAKLESLARLGRLTQVDKVDTKWYA